MIENPQTGAEEEALEVQLQPSPVQEEQELLQITGPGGPHRATGNQATGKVGKGLSLVPISRGQTLGSYVMSHSCLLSASCKLGF